MKKEKGLLGNIHPRGNPIGENLKGQNKWPHNMKVAGQIEIDGPFLLVGAEASRTWGRCAGG